MPSTLNNRNWKLLVATSDSRIVYSSADIWAVEDLFNDATEVHISKRLPERLGSPSDILHQTTCPRSCESGHDLYCGSATTLAYRMVQSDEAEEEIWGAAHKMPPHVDSSLRRGALMTNMCDIAAHFLKEMVRLVLSQRMSLNDCYNHALICLSRPRSHSPLDEGRPPQTLHLLLRIPASIRLSFCTLYRNE